MLFINYIVINSRVKIMESNILPYRLLPKGLGDQLTASFQIDLSLAHWDAMISLRFTLDQRAISTANEHLGNENLKDLLGARATTKQACV